MSLLVLSCQDPSKSIPLANPAQRFVIGLAADEPVNGIESWMIEESRQDFLKERQLAWQIWQNLWQSLEVGVEQNRSSIPLWLTWYDPQELSRLFRELYRQHGAAARQARAPFPPASIASILLWNRQLAEDLPEWGNDRIKEWLREWQSSEQWHGLAGLSRTLYSPLAIQHILQNYAAIERCYRIMEASDVTETIPQAPCSIDEFPYGSIILKTSWARLDSRMPWKHYPLSDESFHEVLQSDSKSWTELEQEKSNLYPHGFIMQTVSGQRFLLTGMHAMVKISRHWHWLTLWWSEDSQQKSNFAFDRPDEASPWLASYQMCSSNDFSDHREFDDITSTVSIARQASFPETWCSNPYLEKGQHNQKTNCIGCHQFAGLNTTSEDILTDDSLFPRYGKTEQMLEFVADYLWSFQQGPGAFAKMIHETMTHYDQSDRFQQ